MTRVAVVVNSSAGLLTSLRTAGCFEAIQFHGDEDPAFCAAAGFPVWIRAVRVRDAASLAAALHYETPYLLLDGWSEGSYGGAGLRLDWELARAFAAQNPGRRVILAGGLTPENVASAVAAVRPFAVDVASGVEGADALRKDPLRIRQFIEAVRMGRRDPAATSFSETLFSFFSQGTSHLLGKLKMITHIGAIYGMASQEFATTGITQHVKHLWNDRLTARDSSRSRDHVVALIRLTEGSFGVESGHFAYSTHFISPMQVSSYEWLKGASSDQGAKTEVTSCATLGRPASTQSGQSCSNFRPSAFSHDLFPYSGNSQQNSSQSSSSPGSPHLWHHSMQSISLACAAIGYLLAAA